MCFLNLIIIRRKLIFQTFMGHKSVLTHCEKEKKCNKKVINQLEIAAFIIHWLETFTARYVFFLIYLSLPELSTDITDIGYPLTLSNST